MISCVLFFFFFKCYAAHRDLHSFPTRRSSDLEARSHSDRPGLSARPGRGRHPIERHPFQRHDARPPCPRSEEHTSELQSQSNLVCRLLLEKKKKKKQQLYENKLLTIQINSLTT